MQNALLWGLYRRYRVLPALSGRHEILTFGFASVQSSHRFPETCHDWGFRLGLWVIVVVVSRSSDALYSGRTCPTLVCPRGKPSLRCTNRKSVSPSICRHVVTSLEEPSALRSRMVRGKKSPQADALISKNMHKTQNFQCYGGWMESPILKACCEQRGGRRQPIDWLLLKGTDDKSCVCAAFVVLFRIDRPSNAHIMVSNQEAASAWGTACSVWPLGDSLEYTWFDNCVEL